MALAPHGSRGGDHRGRGGDPVHVALGELVQGRRHPDRVSRGGYLTAVGDQRAIEDAREEEADDDGVCLDRNHTEHAGPLDGDTYHVVHPDLEANPDSVAQRDADAYRFGDPDHHSDDVANPHRDDPDGDPNVDYRHHGADIRRFSDLGSNRHRLAGAAPGQYGPCLVMSRTIGTMTTSIRMRGGIGPVNVIV